MPDDLKSMTTDGLQSRLVLIDEMLCTVWGTGLRAELGREKDSIHSELDRRQTREAEDMMPPIEVLERMAEVSKPPQSWHDEEGESCPRT